MVCLSKKIISRQRFIAKWDNRLETKIKSHRWGEIVKCLLIDLFFFLDICQRASSPQSNDIPYILPKMPHRKRKSSSALSSPFARTSTPRTTSTAISLCLVYTITILFAVVPITPIHSAEISVDTTQLKPIASPHPHPLDTQSARRKGPLNDVQTIDTQGIQDMILEYIDQTLHRRTFEILTGLSIAAKNNSIADAKAPVTQSTRESRRLDDVTTTDTFDVQLVRRFKQFAETRVLNLSLSRALDAGSRSFFFKSKRAGGSRASH